MKDQNTSKRLSDFYEEKELSPEQMEKIKRLVARDLEPAGKPMQKRMELHRMTPWFSAAAAFLLTISLVLVYERNDRPLSTLFSVSQTNDMDLNRLSNIPQATILVINFSAEWCRPSQTLTPMYEDLKQTYDARQTLFVTLDLTDEAAVTQSKYLVSALGIEDIWNTQNGITGELLYVDMRTRKIIKSFNDHNEFEQMSIALGEAISAQDDNT